MHALFAAFFTSRLADVPFGRLRGGIRGTGKANASARTFWFAFATSTHRDGIPKLSSIEPRWRRRGAGQAQPVPTVNLLAPSRESRENGGVARLTQFPLGSASDTDAEKAYDSRSRYGRWRSPEGAGITRDRRGMSGVTSDQPVWAVDMGIGTFFTRDWTARDERDPPRAFCGRRVGWK